MTDSKETCLCPHNITIPQEPSVEELKAAKTFGCMASGCGDDVVVFAMVCNVVGKEHMAKTFGYCGRYLTELTMKNLKEVGGIRINKVICVPR